MTDKYQQAQQNRQAILDFLGERPHANTLLISESLGLDVKHTFRLLKSMAAMVEVRRFGKGKSIRWEAVSKTTISADVCRVKALHGEEGYQVPRPSRRNDLGCARYVHCADKPIPHQGGQGGIISPRTGTILEVRG